MADMIATRESYGRSLLELGGQNQRIVVLDADLSGPTKTALFARSFPERFTNCGIAESNMIGCAAGMAASGLIPFASTFAMFAAGRAFEQIRNSVCYPHLNVKIAATHGGLAVGEDGATHQCCEDFALMRVLPGMTVLCPADDWDTRQAVRAAAEYNGPVYMRLGRDSVPVLDRDSSVSFSIGKAERLRYGGDAAVIAAGSMVAPALEAAEMLNAEGLNVSVLNMHTIKPLDREAVLEAAARCGAVVTAEDHNVIGGLGSAVTELLCGELPCPVFRVGVNDVFGCSGKAAELYAMYGLTAESIRAAVKSALELKHRAGKKQGPHI